MAKYKIPEVIYVPTDTERKLYFDNNLVEHLLVLYLHTGCTDVKLRDQIMSHAGELIRQIIRAHNLHKIYPGHEDSAFGDLFQTAWIQIEKTLYKYKARPYCADCYCNKKPHLSIVYSPDVMEYGIITPEEVAKRKIKCPSCKKLPSKLIYRGTSKIFNMWSQVARTVILAYIKKESRDYKNSDSYRTFLDDKKVQEVDKFERFITEAREMCQYNATHMVIVDALAKIVKTDDKPYEGLIGKLAALSGESRTQVSNFLRTIRLYSFEFTDSPINVRENCIDDKKYQIDFELADGE